MQRLCRRFFNPFQAFNLLHGYHPLLPYSTSTSNSASTGFLVNYLVDSLGFSPQQALSASNKLTARRKVNSINFNANADSIVGFFKSYGFDDTHLTRIVSRRPGLLCSNADDTLRPKLQLLQDEGFSKSDIIQVVYANPRLLHFGMESSIVPAVEVLRKVVVSDTRVIEILKKPWFDPSITKHLMRNVALLASYGIPIELIRKHLLRLPIAFMRKPEIFNDMVARVKNKWGICPKSPMFLVGIQLASGLSEEVIEAKCRMFKTFGWSESDIQTLMMKNPGCFCCSEAVIKNKLTFLMNELRLEPAYLISNCSFFTYSLEKRIVPRHKILLFLKEKGLLEKNLALISAITMTESRFLNRFVIPFKEVYEVYAELTGCRSSSSSDLCYRLNSLLNGL